MHELKALIPQSIKNVYHFFMAALANILYGFPSRKIKIIGVTGTNGKTTTVQMIYKILEEAGKRVAVASTINFKIGEKEWVNKTKFTTLSPFSVQKFISQSIKLGCEYLVLETSSHALDQYRVWGVRYDTAIITNVTREHLDYHKDMKSYRLAKARLFKEVSKNRGASIVNLDMENPEEYLANQNEKAFGYTTRKDFSKINANANVKQPEVIKAENIEVGSGHSGFDVKNTRFLLNIPGNFNIENALAAICVGLSENISLEICASALEKIKGIPGRMESVPNDKGINIIIDYAVTPDSLEKLYKTIRNMWKDSKIIAVFGSCGERDRGKRPIMGKIVSEHSDYAFITNEDPYYEDPMQIIEEVASGIIKLEEGKNFWKVLDRKEAIIRSLKIAKNNDIVVITGKGAEETMAIGGKRIPWNDKKIVLAALESLD